MGLRTGVTQIERDISLNAISAPTGSQNEPEGKWPVQLQLRRKKITLWTHPVVPPNFQFVQLSRQ